MQKFILITLLKLITVDEFGVDKMGVDEIVSRNLIYEAINEAICEIHYTKRPAEVSQNITGVYYFFARIGTCI